MGQTSFDVVVIGGGPGGYPTAIRASQLGLRVALVEREHLGGVCLNWGCIPTKALLRSAEVAHVLSRLGEFGFSASDIQFDIQKVVKRSRRISKRLNTGVKHLLKKNAVEVFDGHGHLAGPGSVRVTRDEEAAVELTARSVVIASGARSRDLPGVESDAEIVWSYKQAMVPDRVPGSLLVVGAGAIGMEFASFYRDMGAEVSVVEMLPRILPAEDEEISTLAHKQFERRGMNLYTGATLGELQRTGEGATVKLQLESGESHVASVERIIVAVGIAGNVEDLGLDATAVQVVDGHIVTDQWCETAEPGVYAVGDVAGPPWLAHKATHEGVLAAERIAGVSELLPLDTRRIPSCTYCRPQIASVGLSEAKARETGHDVRVGRFPFLANGKALALGENEGMVKTVFDASTGELLGAHMIGAEVTEMIQGFVMAMNLESTEAEIIHTVFAHPTLSEAMHESTLAAFERAIHT